MIWVYMRDTFSQHQASDMEAAALCMQIFMNLFVFLLIRPGLSYTDQKLAFPIVSPDRLQFFEYESVFVSCEEDKQVKAWRVKRKLHKMSSASHPEACSVAAASCSIQFAFERHSGEYWCENHAGEKSRALNISVTAGPVILNISARPVKEGSDVTLHCFNKNTKKTHISDFYKDGVHLTTYYRTDMTLGNVSKSDEGFYKCTISRAGESPESWLAVTSAAAEEEEEGSNEKTNLMKNVPLIIIILLSTIFTLLFWLVGLILYKKRKDLKNEIVSDPKDTTYAFVKKPGQRKGEDAADKPDSITYAAIEIKKRGSKVSSAATNRSSSEQESVYSSVALKT